MKILVIGSGGREHALAWRLAQGRKVQKVFVAPGNAGTALEDGVENVAISAIPELIEFVKREDIYMTVVGPEAPLAAGIVDAFRAEKLKIFGPTKAAAQLESSKDFAKRFMTRHNIPTAFFETFSDIAQARAYVEKHGAPIVIKADGLAAGKGVVVAMSKDEAFAAIDMMLSDNKLGDAGARVVIEEFLAGEEASFIVMVDGKHVLAMATSQDHKRLLDGDNGPNTGGMGAYSPAPVVTPTLHARVLREVIQPVVRGMESEGVTYTGFLYAGLMISPDGGHQGAGIQLPHGRSRNPADHDAPEERFRGDGGTRHRGHAGQGGGGMGQAHRAGRGDGGRQLSRRAAQGRCHQRACPIASRRRSRKMRMCSTPARPCRMARWSPAAGACCASLPWAPCSKWRRSSRMKWRTASISMVAQMRRDIGWRAINRK